MGRWRVLLALGLVLSPAGSSEDSIPGLVATYSDRSHRVRLVVHGPSFYLQPDESLHPAIGNTFDAEWKGQIAILQAGRYGIFTGTAQVTIDGRKLTGAPVSLAGGNHPIVIRYHRQPGVASLRLEWQGPSFSREPIPGSVFSYRAADAPSRDQNLAERGRYLVEEFGCVNCHAGSSKSLKGREGPDLTGISSRVDARWLAQWLESPTAFRSGAVMPALGGEQERRDVASYLSSLKAAGPGPKLRKPATNDIAVGTQLFGLLGCSACHQQDGLALDGMGSKTTLAPLIDYLKNPAKTDPSGRMPSMLLTDEEAFSLAVFLTDSRNREFEQPSPAGDPARGKELVQSQGCLGCHALRDPEPLENRRTAPRLEKLPPNRGCLASEPANHVPRYRLSSDERGALQAFLASYQQHPDISPAPVYALYRSVQQLRCVACHRVDQLAPSAALAEAAPPLDDTGAKLHTAWIDAVLTKRERVHPWLELRMPDYDPRHATPLAEAFAKAAGVERGDGQPGPHATDAQRTRGAGMIGTDSQKGGMACIGCHHWGRYQSLGEEAPQLINVTRRLRYDWYQRWMLNPARILSGTSMPNYFTSMDRKRADEMIQSLWAGLSMAERMPLPDGLRLAEQADAEALPVPERTPIVIRWDMPEATPAAIAVGMPGGVSYCFDAGESRLRYAWLGGFVDMTVTLHRKTNPDRLTPTAKLIGEIFYRSEEFPLRLEKPDRVPQRRFRGYRLMNGFPQFHYQVDGIDVYERIVPAADQRGITREFAIARVDQPAWFVAGEAASGVTIKSSIGDGGTLQIPMGKDVRFQVTIMRSTEPRP